ncbi:MAG: SpoIID/LytB domain-containing protein [Firmicutes bacterium]|nr:SpoIID/LytB domain-containing protein [Bacillota bacterium]
MQLRLSHFNRFCLVLLMIALITLIVSSQEDKENSTELRFRAAVNRYYQGDFETSIRQLENLVRAYPRQEKIRFNLVYLLREAGRFSEALEHLTYLRKINPVEEQYQQAYLTTTYLAGRAAEVLKLEGDKTEDLFWKGLAAYDLQDYKQAATYLAAALEQADFNPLANYYMGLISLEKEDFSTARTYLIKALTQDPNLMVARYDLARAELGRQDYRAAYYRLKQAEAAAPRNQQIQTDLKNLLAAHPYLLDEERKEEETGRIIAAAPSVVPVTPGGTTIRIGLAEKVGQIFTKTGAAFRLTSTTGSELLSGAAQTILKFTFSPAGKIQVYDAQDQLLATAESTLVLSYRDPGATTLLFNLEYGRGYYWAGSENRAYRGEIHFLPFANGFTVVNQLTIEEYLYSVVPSEMPSSWPAAALEAQAIAARTYALSHLGNYRQRGFDLLSSVASQAYNGVKNETPSVREAVNATKGQILTYEGKPISAYYSANSGGYTDLPPATWNFSPPYLQAVSDPKLTAHDGFPAPATLAAWVKERLPSYSAHPKYSARSAYRWQVIVPRTEIEDRLRPSVEIGQITGLITLGRKKSGRVEQVLIQGTKGDYLVKGDRIRSTLGGLRSNLFVVAPKMGEDGLPEYFFFTGAGFGHGVGLDQSGAAGMAAEGWTAQQILEHYYPGTSITQLY